MDPNIDRLKRDQQAWLEKHRDADMLIVDTKIGQVTEAHYYSPEKKNEDSKREYLRSFFKAVAEAGGFDDGEEF